MSGIGLVLCEIWDNFEKTKNSIARCNPMTACVKMTMPLLSRWPIISIDTPNLIATDYLLESGMDRMYLSLRGRVSNVGLWQIEDIHEYIGRDLLQRWHFSGKFKSIFLQSYLFLSDSEWHLCNFFLKTVKGEKMYKDFLIAKCWIRSNLVKFVFFQ